MAITETYSVTITDPRTGEKTTREVNQDEAIDFYAAAHRVAALAVLDDGNYTLTIVRRGVRVSYDLSVYEDGTRYHLKGN
jgi:hypothetical protein